MKSSTFKIITLAAFLVLGSCVIPCGCADGYLGIEGRVYEWIDAPEGEIGKIYIDEELPSEITVKPIENAAITVSPMGEEDSKEIIVSFSEVHTDSSGYFEEGYVVAPMKGKFQLKVEREGYLEVVTEFMHPIKRGAFERSILVVMVREG